MPHSLPQASLIQAQTRNRRPGARTFIITGRARQRVNTLLFSQQQPLNNLFM
ncbi:hypothetical protein V2K52_02370 [Pseudomonas alliivorans]|nr:hypothetical protein [Pseudomonas alliivorans]MEE4793298.1 hypothetical protein [Pseudomonas alliivorans]MEE4798433.1 hypothetical protein [Pseudomonas alliivorans]MEE4808752.1 hypothetical protein [Pseudomonas alliivorans]MEE4823736.1 hypothetical protein [Pseudomonas alliivorans]